MTMQRLNITCHRPEMFPISFLKNHASAAYDKPRNVRRNTSSTLHQGHYSLDMQVAISLVYNEPHKRF